MNKIALGIVLVMLPLSSPVRADTFAGPGDFTYPGLRKQVVAPESKVDPIKLVKGNDPAPSCQKCDDPEEK